jgi:acetyl-CoA carboxylase carboxyl transferase subunit alpha
MDYLDFETPLIEIEKNIAQLKEKALKEKIDFSETIGKLEKEVQEKKRILYQNLRPDQRLKIARHPSRPHTLDYLSLVFTDFMELHGDRCFGDDPAIMGGLAKISTSKNEFQRVLVLGQQKGRDTKEKLFRNFGMAHPEGYRKALRLMQMAERFHLPIVCLIDIPGAYPGISAEERGQASAIAVNLREMMNLRTPMICIIIGEGGSGGALGIGVGDRVIMLEHSYYSVISPEGCSAILWKTSDRSADAAKALKMTARDLLGFGIIDSIVEEPLGGAHRDPQTTAATLKKTILASIEELSRIKTTELLKRRYEKYRQMGAYHSSASQGSASFQGAISRPSSTKPLSSVTVTSFKN